MAMVYSILPGLFGLITDLDVGGLFSTVGWAFGDDDKLYFGNDGHANFVATSNALY